MRLRHRRFEDEPTLGARIEAGFQYGLRLTLRLRPLDTLPQNPVAAEMRLAAHFVMNQEEGHQLYGTKGISKTFAGSSATVMKQFSIQIAGLPSARNA